MIIWWCSHSFWGWEKHPLTYINVEHTFGKKIAHLVFVFFFSLGILMTRPLTRTSGSFQLSELQKQRIARQRRWGESWDRELDGHPTWRWDINTFMWYPLVIQYSYFKWPFYSWFMYDHWWFSIAMLVYQRASKPNPINHPKPSAMNHPQCRWWAKLFPKWACHRVK